MPPSSSLSELRLRNRAGCPGVLEVWQRFTGFWATSIDVSGSKSQLGSRRKVPGQRSASTYAGEVVRMLLLFEDKDSHRLVLFAASKHVHGIDVDLNRIGIRQSKCFLHYHVSVGLAPHGVEHRSFSLQGGEVFMADGGAAEGSRDGLVGPDQCLVEVDLVIGAELRGRLPVFVAETGSGLELLTNFRNIQFAHVRHVDLQGKPFLLPPQKRRGRVGT